MFCCALFRITSPQLCNRYAENRSGGGSGCTMAVAVAAADKLSGATLPPSGNTLPLRGLKMAVAEAVAAAGDPTGHRMILNRIVIFVGVIHDTLNFKYRPSLPKTF